MFEILLSKYICVYLLSVSLTENRVKYWLLNTLNFIYKSVFSVLIKNIFREVDCGGITTYNILMCVPFQNCLIQLYKSRFTLMFNSSNCWNNCFTSFHPTIHSDFQCKRPILSVPVSDHWLQTAKLNQYFARESKQNWGADEKPALRSEFILWSFHASFRFCSFGVTCSVEVNTDVIWNLQTLL